MPQQINASSNELREIQELKDRIKKLEGALYNSTELLEVAVPSIENVYDANYMRSQIDLNKKLLSQP